MTTPEICILLIVLAIFGMGYAVDRMATPYDTIDDDSWTEWCEHPAMWSGLFWGAVAVTSLCTVAVFVGFVGYLLTKFSA